MLVAAVVPSPVVVDFVAGQGLAQAKSSCGYFLQESHGRGPPAEGLLVVYNFGDSPACGELVLEGDAWTLADGGRRTAFELAPGDRRETGVRIAPPGNRFVAHRVRAIWREADLAARKAESGGRITVDEQVEEMPPQATVTRPAGLVSKRVRPDTPERREALEMYFRTRNGNLYATWPRLTATGQWARYMERMGNFSMAFYGRANPPWRFKDNEPVALVFFFRPAALPATFEIRGAQVAEFSEP